MSTKTRRGLHVKMVGMTFHADYPEWVWDIGYPDFPEVKPQLLREPKNPYDPNAVAVTILEDNRIVGHLPAIIAKTIGPEMDKGIKWEIKSAYVIHHPDHPDAPGVELVLMRDSSHLD